MGYYEINKEFYNFIWKGKRDKICRKVLINSYESGGPQMVDFKALCQAMKAACAVRLLKNNK